MALITTRRAAATLATTAIMAGGLVTTAQASTGPDQSGHRSSGTNSRTDAQRPAPGTTDRSAPSTTDRSAPRASAATTTSYAQLKKASTVTGTRTAAAAPVRTALVSAATSSSSTTSASSVTSSSRATTAAASTSSTAVNYASSTTVSTAGLSANAVKVIQAINGDFPEITSIGGLRSGSDAQDHGTGHAVDLMIPDYSTSEGKALGDEIAAYLQEHAEELGVKYVIWSQHIWSVQRSSEGWRAMSDRGGVTANHYDHVHVSVN
ncbi:MAG TPA: hypothetical protein H9987_03800 [Candidatus Luteococcus avicola]|nr:hypothetical protein [Candidatus Luteococcus avicola]